MTPRKVKKKIPTSCSTSNLLQCLKQQEQVRQRGQ
ncbi:hypothetical protein AWRI1631_60480 [Saccharomyces cerevisiae AWRI1631]|uniref:Uncharacterized protein n=1 Tax=Saccharomyces cerevisiae (strain AWRI1631) TaxID=545124 RepID=B5VI15_YEAS6|nr:hypothetical protein AWRI1631_60480 [Saccharomyces cerevisiae AWRI1631]